MSTLSPALSAPRDAPELLHRVLALIDTIHKPEDLTPERMEQFVGQPMIREISQDRSPDSYAAIQELTDMWWYSLRWVVNLTTKRPNLHLRFNETEKYSSKYPPLTGICRFDEAQFHEALLKLGYEHVGDTRRGIPARQYQRGSVEVEVGYVGESSETLEKISHKCIKGVSVRFRVTLEEIER